MAYTDITQTGGNTWQELQTQNNSQFIQGIPYDPLYNEFMQSDVGILHGNPSELVEIGSSINDPIPWGESRYDANPTSLADYTERNNRRAYNQPTILKWASGAGKFLTTAGTTAISGTAGLVFGIGEGAIAASNSKDGEGWTDFWHSFSNNQVSKAMADFSTKMENVFVNYYTDYERQAPWWKNMSTANFWADGVLKNAGFTAGAVAAAMAWGYALPFLGSSAVVGTSAAGVKGLLGGFAKMLLGSVGEANIESIHGVNELYNNLNQSVKTTTQYVTQIAKNQYSIDLLTMGHAAASAKYQKELERINTEAQQLLTDPDIEKSIKEAGNAIFGLNTALLAITNTFEVSNLIRGGKTFAQQIASNSVKPILKETGEELVGTAIGQAAKTGSLQYGADLLKKPWLSMAGRTLATGLSEGIIEEGGQGWISSSEKLYALSKWKHTPLSAYMATDFFPEVVDRVSAYNKAFQEQYGDIDGQGWQEVAMGFIGGILGSPFFGRKQNKDGTSSWGFQWIGGLKNAYDETIGQNEETKNFIQQLNSQLNDPKFAEKFYKAAGLMQSDTEALNAIRRGDVATFKQEEFNAIAQQVELFSSLGRIDDLINIYKGFAESFSEEDIPTFKEATGLDLSAYTNEEIVNQFKEKAKTTLDKIEIYRNSMKTVQEFMNTSEFQTEFAEYLQDPVTRKIIHSHLAFGDANIAELKRRRDKVQSKLNSLNIDDDAIEISQLNKDLTDINKQLDNAHTLEYKKKHLKETKKEFDKLFDYINKVGVGNKVDSAIQALSQATTLAEVAENFQYLNPDIKDAVVNGVKNAASPELKELIEKYENFNRIQKIIQSELTGISDFFSYALDETDRASLLNILQHEFGKAVTQTLMSNTEDLSSSALKNILEEVINNDFLDDINVDDTTKFWVQQSLIKLKNTIDTAYSVPTPTPVATGTGTSTISTGCKYENVDIITDPDVQEMLEETAFQNLLNVNKHEEYDRYFNTLFITDEDTVLFDKALDACKTYFEKHPDATIKDATIALLRDVFTKADIADFQKAAFIAQVVFNKVEAHPIPVIPIPATPVPTPTPQTSSQQMTLSDEIKTQFQTAVNNTSPSTLTKVLTWLQEAIQTNTLNIPFGISDDIIVSTLSWNNILEDVHVVKNGYEYKVLEPQLFKEVVSFIEILASDVNHPEIIIPIPEIPIGVNTPPVQAPQTTTTNPQTTAQQEPKPQQPVQTPTPKQPVFMFGDGQQYYEWVAQGIEKHNDWGLPKWLMDNGYNLDLMRTKYLRYITTETPIHFIYHKDVANIQGLSKVALTPIFLAIDVESLPNNVFNEPTSNKMVVESDGKRYILIGTYGGFKVAPKGQEQIKSAQDVHWRTMLNNLQQQANNTTNKVVVSPYTTNILTKDGITYGNVVTAIQDKDGTHYHKSELIQMLGNPEQNPLDFTKDTLKFYVNYGVSKHITHGVSLDDIIGGNELTEGQVYVLLPATTLGKYVPFKLNTVTLKEKEKEVEANTKFKNRLLNALSGLVDTELANSQNEELINKTLNAAKQEVFKYLNFKEIAHLGYSKPTPGKTIKINLYCESGGAITTLLDLGTVTAENKQAKVQELYNAILALDVAHSPLINIEGAWISDPNENSMYFGEDTVNGTDSLLTTGTNMLAVQHSNFFVHAVDENGNMITQGFSKTTTPKQKEEQPKMKVYNIAGINYRYNPLTKIITTESGEQLKPDDPTYLYVNAILNNTPFTITVGSTSQTYIPCGTLLIRYANKAYTLVVDEKDVAKILTQQHQQVQAKSTEEKATKIVEEIKTTEEKPQQLEQPKQLEKPTVSVNNHQNVNIEVVMALTGFTEEEVIQRITANDKAQHQDLYIMANDELAIHLTQRIAEQAKLNRQQRRGYPKGIITQVPQVNDALQSLLDFRKNPINKDLLMELGLQDKTPIDILRMLVTKHPTRDYNEYYNQDRLVNDLNELVNCK